MDNRLKSQSESERNLMGAREIAQTLGVSVNTIRTWVWQKQIPYLKVGRLVRFDIREIDAWLQDKKITVIK